MGKKKGKDRSVSEIVQARPSYTDIYTPDEAVKPEHTADTGDGVWIPPAGAMDWMNNPLPDVDDSLHLSFSEADVEADTLRLLGIDGNDNAPGVHGTYTDSEGESYETDSYETDSGGYETDSVPPKPVTPPKSRKNKLSEIKEEKKSMKKKSSGSDSSDSDDSSNSSSSSGSSSSGSSSSGSSSDRSSSSSSSGSSSDGSDSSGESTNSKSKGSDSDDSRSDEESDTKASSKSGSEDSESKDSDDSSSLPSQPKSRSKSRSKSGSRSSKSSDSSGSGSADTPDDSDEDSDDEIPPRSALSSSSDSSSSLGLGGVPVGRRQQDYDPPGPRLSRSEQNRAFMRQASNRPPQTRSPQRPQSNRMYSQDDQVVPEKEKKSLFQRLYDFLPSFMKSSHGQPQKPSYPQRRGGSYVRPPPPARAPGPPPVSPRAPPRPRPAPPPTPNSASRISFLRKSKYATPPAAQQPSGQYRAPIRPPPPPPPPPLPRRPESEQVPQAPAPFDYVNPQYHPMDHADGVSQISETGYERRRQRERELAQPRDQYGYVDSVPRHQDKRQTYLPSIASSHMSVRNTKAALSDMDPISVGFTGKAIPDYEPHRDARNTRSALSSMRPLSIPHERYRNDSRHKVALSNLEPLSVGVSYSPSLNDDLSEKSGTYRYDLESGWRKAKDGTTNKQTIEHNEVNLDEMLRVEREKNVRTQREKIQEEEAVRRQLADEENAKERARRYREQERIRRMQEEERARRIQENERVRRIREEERRRAIELAERERAATEGSDRHRKQDAVDKPVYFRLSLLCICMICLLLGACLGVGIWALLEYVVLKDEKTPSTVVVTPTNAPAAQPSPSPRPSPSPVPAPTSQPSTPSKILEDILKPVLPDGGTSLGDQNSPQAKAFEWLEKDSRLQSYSEEKIRQRFGLAVFYYSTDGDKWIRKDRWLSEFDECTWYTAFEDSPCRGEDFSHLVLGNNNIQGTLPVELVLLNNNLESISIGGTITGSLPSEYGDLTLLRTLQIHGRNIGGSISSSFKNLDFLKTLDLGKNRLSGKLSPTLLSSMRRLQILDLSGNRLTGSLPTQVGIMTSLRELNLRENFLEGSIPFEIGDIANLQSLILDGNKFNSMPRNLGFLTTLRVLSIRDNALSGTIPGELGLLTKLTALYLDRNKLRWTIPAQLGELKELKDGLGLSDNSLVGDIPTELGRLYGLQNLLLAKNKLRGTIPATLGNINRLHTLRLEGNNLSGTMPSSVCAGFSRDFSTFYADCSEVDCPCCNFCCSDTTSQCTCPFKETDPILCIP